MPFKTNRLLLLLLLAALFLPGCGFKGIFSKKDHSRADAFARNFIQILRKGDIAEIKAASVLDLASKGADKKLEKAEADLGQGPIVSVETVSAESYHDYFSPVRQTLLGYQIKFKKGWAKAIVLVDDTKGNMKVSTLYTETLEKPMQEIYAFSFTGAPLSNYLMLLFTIAVPAFIVYTIFLSLRTPLAYKRILWISFMLVGIGTLRYDWSSGQVGFSLLAPVFMGSGVYKATIYGPWMLTTSCPVGAIIFFFYRNNLIEKKIIEAARAARAEGKAIEG